MATPETTNLHWSADGKIGCGKPGHTPFKGTDTWRREGWKAMTAWQIAEWERHAGAPPRCECCEAARKK